MSGTGAPIKAHARDDTPTRERALSPARSPHQRPRRAQFVAMLEKTDWGSKSRRHFLSREEEYTEALRAALGIWWVGCVAGRTFGVCSAGGHPANWHAAGATCMQAAHGASRAAALHFQDKGRSS